MTDVKSTIPALPLREFAYLDEDILDDFLAALLGGLAGGRKASGRRTTPTTEGELSLKVARAKRTGAVEETAWEELQMQTAASKFEKVHRSLKDGGYISALGSFQPADWAGLKEGDVFETRGRVEFSALEELIDLFRKVIEMAELMEPGKKADPSWRQFITYIDLIGGEKKSYRIRFVPGGAPADKHCFVADVETGKLKRDKQALQGNYTLLGRVQHKLGRKETYELYSLLPRGIRLPRSQAEELLQHFKDMPEVLGRPPQWRDLYVEFPALVATPIAIYR